MAGTVRIREKTEITTGLQDIDLLLLEHDPGGSNDADKKLALSTLKTYINAEVTAQINAILNSKGVSNGFAGLDGSGKVPESQLPSYVDDVLEYSSQSAFPATGETGKIYVATDTNKSYRWGGSTYIEIASSLALGETDSTAYRGDRGKTAYDHSQLTSGNPHQVGKSDVGLGSVVNTGDSAIPTQNGTTKFTTGGAYTELAKKVDKVNGKGLSTNDFANSYKDILDKTATCIYCTCTTPASTAIKELTPSTSEAVLKTGCFIAVKFTYSNTAPNVTFKYGNSTYSIYYNGSAYTSTWNAITGLANVMLYYMFDGTGFVWMGMSSIRDGFVGQNNITTSAEYRVLFSRTADDTNRTEGTGKSANLTFNPSTGVLTPSGGVVLPILTATPSNPVNGQIWIQ